MNKLNLITTDKFNTAVCDFYSDGENEVYLNRVQIGTALGYNDPNDAIKQIHKKHKDRLDKFSIRIKEKTTKNEDSHEGGQINPSRENSRPQNNKLQSEVVYYSERGIMEICRWSKMPKANDFMDWCYNIILAYRNHSLISVDKFNALLEAFNEMKNQIAEMRQKTKWLESKTEKLDTEIEKVDTKAMSALATVGAIESGHSIINGKMSDWVVAMSEKVRKLAAAADCSVSHMYSKLIENMEQKHHVKFKEFYGSYRHIFPQEEHPWRICVIDYFEDELLYCFEDVYRDEAEYYGLVAPRRKEDEWYPITVL